MLTTPSGLQRQIVDAPATYWASDTGTSSCEVATMVGTGRIVIGRSTRLGFELHESRVAPAAALVVKGARSGAAIAEANLPPSENPQAVASACSTSGLATAPVDITLRTAPNIS